MYWSEKYQLGLISHYLRENGYSYATEAEIYSVPVDILGCNKEHTVAIELKSQDFKQGIRQATRNTKFVDYSYLSVWQENITGQLIDRIEELPIGLLAAKNQVECLSPPTCNDINATVNAIVRERVQANVRE